MTADRRGDKTIAFATVFALAFWCGCGSGRGDASDGIPLGDGEVIDEDVDDRRDDADDRDDRDDDDEAPVVDSDPDVVATFAPWEQQCIRWLRTDCEKAVGCDVIPSDECGYNDIALRERCREMVREEGCETATAPSFGDCADRTAAETCAEWCEGQFCFNFCSITCA